MAYNDPNACPTHGYNLQWLTCINCDIIKLTAQNSPGFVDRSGMFSRYPDPEAPTQRSRTANSTLERQRSTPQVLSTTYFSDDNPYNFNTGDDHDDHPDWFALSSDDENPEDLALSDAEKTAQSRNRPQKRAKAKAMAKAKAKAKTMVEDDDSDLERLAHSAEEAPPRIFRCGTLKGRNMIRKPAAKHRRHVKFSE